MAELLRWITGLALRLAAADAGGRSTWLPRRASTTAADVDAAWAVVFWISVFFFFLITFLVVFFAIRYRGQRGIGPREYLKHNTPLEVTWSIIPLGIVIYLFYMGFTGYLNLVTPPENTYEVQVTAQKWNWLFTYPNGHINAELHVPVNQPVRLVMSSEDVLHSFYVPDFRVKQDVVPGRYTTLWFEATETGEMDIFCTEYCGTKHSNMLSKVVVHAPGEFESWLEEASDIFKDRPLWQVGELLYNQRGCKQCHSLDGSRGTGPSFKNLWGTQHALQDGSQVTVDENYVRESILMPQAKLTAGYEPVMPTYQGRLKDKEITAIIEYLKTLNPT